MKGPISQTLLIETLPVIARLTRTAPLGLRFWDEVTGKLVGDGLAVTAYPPSNPWRRIEAVVNRAGVYVLAGLPVLREVEFGNGEVALPNGSPAKATLKDDEFWNSPPAKATFKIEVVDTWRRFQPFLLTIQAPVEKIVTWHDPTLTSPPESSQGIPLYSAASRSAPAAMAVLRAEMREWKSGDNHEGEPASWAVLEARVAGQQIAQGFADEKGRVALFLAYPPPVTHQLGSPPAISAPGNEGPSLRDQKWSIELSARFDKLSPRPPFPDPPPDLVPVLPELVDVLSQSPATLWADTRRDEVLTETVLSFGQEQVIRSVDRATNRARSILLISAAGSPP